MKQVEKKDLTVDCCYSHIEIIEMGMKQLKTEGMKHLVFEKGLNVYYFEELKNGLLRLFCLTSKRSFYL